MSRNPMSPMMVSTSPYLCEVAQPLAPAQEPIIMRRVDAAPVHRAQPAGDVNLELLIERSGCAESFFAVELCMGERDRAWSACQEQVRRLRQCRDAVAAAAAAAATASAAAGAQVP